jgi:hypothetical protein
VKILFIIIKGFLKDSDSKGIKLITGVYNTRKTSIGNAIKEAVV